MRLRLALRARRGLGDLPGEHRVAGRADASGMELAGHRDYAPGDDLRHLDWPALARLDRLIVRQYATERAASVHLILDTSASMAVPAGDRKLETALAVAELLAAIALGGGDTVRLTLFDAAGGLRSSPPLRHRGALPRIRTLLAGARATGALALGDALAAHARLHPRPGLAVVLSDCTDDPERIAAGLLALRARRYDVALLHVIGPGEIEPARERTGGVLRDAESQETHPIRLTPAVRARYAALLAGHLARLADVAARTGTAYARVVAGRPAAEIVAGDLVRHGVLRRR